MTGRVLVVTGRNADGDLTFHCTGHKVIRDRAISSPQLAALRKSVAKSRNGLVWFDGLCLDESDVTQLIGFDAKVPAS